MQSSKLGMKKGYHLSKESMKGYHFCQKWYYKRIQQRYKELNLEAEPPCIKIC